MKKIVLILLMIVSYSFLSAAEFVAVVNGSNQGSVSKATLKRILLGKITKWDNGQKVVIVNLASDDEGFSSLLKDISGKSPIEFKEHWNKLQIQGKGTAPMIQQSTSGAKAMVGNIPGGITFIEKSSVGGNVVELQIK